MEDQSQRRRRRGTELGNLDQQGACCCHGLQGHPQGTRSLELNIQARFEKVGETGGDIAGRGCADRGSLLAGGGPKADGVMFA